MIVGVIHKTTKGFVVLNSRRVCVGGYVCVCVGGGCKLYESLTFHTTCFYSI